MAIPRFYIPNVTFQVGVRTYLPPAARHHAGRVLRMAAGEKASVFNGLGDIATGPIAFEGDDAYITIETLERPKTESPLSITLVQGLISAEKLDYVVEKAVELGVSRIVIVPSIRSTAKLPEDRRDRRLKRWADIMHAACEQCGRNSIPTLEFMQFEKAMENVKADRCYMLALSSTVAPRLTRISSVAFAVGPEGGFSANEIAIAAKFGWESVLIGPRVLRTETAGLVAATLANAASGDMKFY